MSRPRFGRAMPVVPQLLVCGLIILSAVTALRLVGVGIGMAEEDRPGLVLLPIAGLPLILIPVLAAIAVVRAWRGVIVAVIATAFLWGVLGVFRWPDPLGVLSLLIGTAMIALAPLTALRKYLNEVRDKRQSRLRF